MKPWSQQVREALRSDAVRLGIAQIATEWMSDHIRQNIGRGSGGNPEKHKPLKSLSSDFWTQRKPKGAVVLGKRQRVVEALVTQYRSPTGEWSLRKPKGGSVETRKVMATKRVTEYRIAASSYRNGGQPLRDTGSLARSLGATCSGFGNSRLKIRMRGNKYGAYQDRGFTTRGPNYIPLSRKGARDHGTGQNPNAEGLLKGKDYLMAWKGVTVPARPFILPTREDMIDFGRSVYLGLRQVLLRRSR